MLFTICSFRLFLCFCFFLFFFFFNDTATTEIYTLSLHDALPISCRREHERSDPKSMPHGSERSEEHTSELQSPGDLVCRLLLEKKKKKKNNKKKNKKQKKKTKKKNNNI